MALQPGVTPLGNVAGAVEDQSTFTIDGGNNTDDMSGDTRGYITNFTGASGTQTNGIQLTEAYGFRGGPWLRP